jgi:hypothetical protein
MGRGLLFGSLFTTTAVQGKSGASTEAVQEVGNLSRKPFGHHKADTSESLHHSKNDIFVDFSYRESGDRKLSPSPVDE